MTTEPTAKHQEEAERIVGVKSQPVCGECQTRMTYGEGAPEAHVPPHWWCPQHPGAYIADRGKFATHEQQQVIDGIAASLSSRNTQIREVSEGLITHVFGEEDIGPIPHWCPVDEDFDSQYNDACLAARELWERVQS